VCSDALAKPLHREIGSSHCGGGEIAACAKVAVDRKGERRRKRVTTETAWIVQHVHAQNLAGAVEYPVPAADVVMEALTDAPAGR
jgi:hypothetical protein